MTKATWLARYGKGLTQAPSNGGVQPATTYYNLNSSGVASGPAGAESFETAGSSTYWVSQSMSTNVYFKNSNSNTGWYGSSPTNATSIEATMKWWISGVDISVGLPANISFSKSGSGEIWDPPAITNHWIEYLSWSAALHMSATIFTSAGFTDQGDVLLSNHYYHVQGN